MVTAIHLPYLLARMLPPSSVLILSCYQLRWLPTYRTTENSFLRVTETDLRGRFQDHPVRQGCVCQSGGLVFPERVCMCRIQTGRVWVPPVHVICYTESSLQNTTGMTNHIIVPTMLHLHRNCFLNIRYALNSVILLTNAPIFCLNVLGVCGRGKLKPYVCLCVCTRVWQSGAILITGYSDQNKKCCSCTDPLLSRVVVFRSVVRLLSVSCDRFCFQSLTSISALQCLLQ